MADPRWMVSARRCSSSKSSPAASHRSGRLARVVARKARHSQWLTRRRWRTGLPNNCSGLSLSSSGRMRCMVVGTMRKHSRLLVRFSRGRFRHCSTHRRQPSVARPQPYLGPATAQVAVPLSPVRRLQHLMSRLSVHQLAESGPSSGSTTALRRTASCRAFYKAQRPLRRIFRRPAGTSSLPACATGSHTTVTQRRNSPTCTRSTCSSSARSTSIALQPCSQKSTLA